VNSTAVHHDYWDHFYADRASDDVPAKPSAYAREVREDLDPDQTVVEFGFGTARDSLWFAKKGYSVLGFDFSEHAVAHAQARANTRSVPGTFGILDLYDAAAVAACAERLAATVSRPAIYGRFLIHSLEASGRANLLDLAATVLARGGSLYLEFRTGKDEGHEHVFGDDHFRVYLDPVIVVDEIEQRGGTVTSLEEGLGLAVYKSEDPHVARVVATFSG